jgi:hypothetical protein
MKLTHDQQVTNALALLAPKAAEHGQCNRDVEAALMDIMSNGVDPKPYSRDTKDVVRPLIAALTRARDLHKKLVPLDDYGIVSPLDLENLNGQIAFYEEWRDERPDSLHRTSPKQQAAVKEAHALVLKYCGKQFARATRKNKWWKLSAILFGDDQHDLLRHMRAFKNRPDPV